MMYVFRNENYEMNDSTFDGPVPRGAYAVAFATKRVYKGVTWGSPNYAYTDCWVVLQSVYSHETSDFDNIYKWQIVQVFGESQLEQAKTFKNTLTEVAKQITIVP
ncbi:hypothetical protein Aeh1ORF097c [Aeromonas phage Aeh1]|uniref:Uncharacterized protein n=1 Tax=Aeromonas phage Aeh1 TaxID=2880362 RepID=Q76YY8_9CAUD|nr:hypothetical protein Aeh1p103 [Aeromonas phage Aeh1]AAQ17758.1 hypothetical protein Aeh1ORF097c [Aeromonas phage Aeh1]